MVEHLENHPHSFIKNGTVIQVLIFDDHDKDLLEVLKMILKQTKLSVDVT